MHNDSIETLLTRHYGGTAVAPAHLEQRLHTSLRRRATEVQQEQQLITRFHTKAVSRRRAMQFVALSSVGLSIMNIGLESLQAFEASMLGQEAAQHAVTP